MYDILFEDDMKYTYELVKCMLLNLLSFRSKVILFLSIKLNIHNPMLQDQYVLTMLNRPFVIQNI